MNTLTDVSTSRLRCAEIWGGTANVDQDVATAPMAATVFSRSADGERGGDIYYFSVCDNDRIARVAVADVVGHGSAVGRVSAWIYDVLASSMNNADVRSVLAELNARVFPTGLESATTAALMSFDVDGPTVQVSYAGHPPVWLLRSGEHVWRPRPIERTRARENVPLGFFDDARYGATSFVVRSGDRVLIHTDGLTEAFSPSGEPFGEERLARVLEDASDKSLPSLKRNVLDAVRRHTGGSFGDDDVTLVVVEVR